MTFHVRYNDCHLEADMERERGWERDGAIEERVKRDGGRGRRREKRGQSGDGKWFRSPLVLTRRLKPTDRLFPLCRSSRVNLPHFAPFSSLPCGAHFWNFHLLLLLSPSSPCLRSPFGCHQQKLSSFKTDYKMNCTGRRRIFSLGWATTAKGQSWEPSPGLAAGYLLHFPR